MSKIKALETLYNWIGGVAMVDPRIFDDGDCARLRKIAHDIEDEIEEFYMPLPLDAEGVPIRVGDIVEKNGHAGNVWLIGINEFMCTDRRCYSMKDCTHLKPRTLADVLRDFASDYRNTLSRFDAGESSGPSPCELIEKYAYEIRELMEG